MTIFKSIDQLPATAKEYFDFYHNRAFSELVGQGDLENILKELRLAYVKYSDRRNRIEAIAGVLKKGINAPLPKKTIHRR